MNFQKTEAVLKFIDKGPGIPEEEMEKIFQPFYRARNVQHIPGSGIGLSLCLQILELHHGSLRVDSQLNKGSIFTVSIPTTFPLKNH